MKVCTKCKINKTLSDFHKDSKFKGCLKYQCKKCRNEYTRKYWGERKQEKAKKDWVYQQTEKGKQGKKESIKRYRLKFPEKYKAVNMLNNALRDRRITKPETCENCNGRGKLEAHHSDYNKPLEVDWLCRKCHQLWKD